MSETLVPADGQLAAVDELNAVDHEAEYWAPAGTRIPNPKSAEWLRVLSVGGTERDLVTDGHRLVIEAYSANETRSQRICAFAVARLQAAARAGLLGGIPCYGMAVDAIPANLPLPSVPDRVRHTATVTASLRRAAV